MSSFALVSCSPGSLDADRTARKMLSVMETRFTGEPTLFSGADVALGSVPCSFLPEDDADVQPAWSRDKSVCAVADLRIDNRDDLARTLGLLEASRLPDIAFLLAAWERWREDCVLHLIGSFAFALWIPATRTVFAARDHAGEHSLFFHRTPTLVAVASMPKALLTLPGFEVRFDEERIAAWLALNGPARDTSFFHGLVRLPPGAAVTLQDGTATVRQYWHPSDTPPVRFRKDEDYAERLVELVDLATAARLRSRGAISSQLSSGLDSSTVTASAALLLAGAGRGLTAYTAVPQQGFTDTHRNSNIFFDEGPFAAEVAALYPNVRHELVSSEGASVLSTLKRWTDAMDEPVLNATNSVWVTSTLQRARENGSDVLLQGSAGNIGMSYETLRIFADYLRTGRWLKLWRAVNTHRDAGFLSYRVAAHHAFQGLYPQRINGPLRRRKQEFNIGFAGANPEFAREHRMFETTFARYFGPELSVRADQRYGFERFDLGPLTTGARALTGVDPRDPSADKRIWEFCFSIPVEQFVAGGHSRSLVRRAMRGRLPERTLHRYARGHQGADWYFNIRASLPAIREELEEIERSPAACRVLDLPRLKHITETFPDEGFQRLRTLETYHYALMRGVAMGYFLRSHDPALASP